MMTLDPPNLSKELRETKVLDTELGTIYFHNNLIVMEGKENVTISIRTGISILLKVVQLVGTKPVVYISNRINRYSVDPNDYKFLEMIPNLKGLAIVCYSEFAFQTAALEGSFIRKPFRAFSDLTEAKEWAAQIIEGKLSE